ncbi:MAG: ABC transporter ATP-binding protein [Desulfopila sp.]|jgi:NitT/TauT family transport system ATP-binding protein|nr:ABC transporter ATP-binding protein [Desulfopila sp.]
MNMAAQHSSKGASPPQEKFVVANLRHIFTAEKEDPVPVIDDVNFSVRPFEFVAVVGPSGCGKSTLLNIMSGSLKPQSGTVSLDGQALQSITPRIGYISQSDSLLPWRTTLTNVELGMELRKVPKRERRDRAMSLIQQADLSGFENAYPYQLSGGMRKRVDIIKVLAMDPEIIFMDEPFASLDVFTREMLQTYILSLWQTTQRTVLFITHDLTEAIMLSDRVIILTKRPARVKSEHPITLPRPRKPADLRFNPDFIQLHKSIWDDLKDEVHSQEKS